VHSSISSSEVSVPLGATLCKPPAPPRAAATRARRVGSRQRRERRSLLIGIAACTLALLASGFAWKLTPLRERRLAIADVRPPAGREHYLAYDGFALDHYVLYFGLDQRATQQLRAADVLILGTSRLMFAMRPDDLRAHFAGHGKRCYVLGFGHGERDRFPRAIIERFDLRPEWVVVNADGFFVDELSDFARSVVQAFPLKARATYYERCLDNAVRRALHRYIPHWLSIAQQRREYLIYRSREDGTWLIEAVPDAHLAFAPQSGEQDITPRELAAARQFQQTLAGQGARLMLTCVPGPNVNPRRAARLADALGVPLIYPELDNLATCDGSHLTPDSAARFVSAFLGELDAFWASHAARADEVACESVRPERTPRATAERSPGPRR
jgi:hypothetical protein